MRVAQAGADDERVATVNKRMPKVIKKKRQLQGADGEQAGWEEYYDYVYPEEEAKAPRSSARTGLSTSLARAHP